MTVLFDIHTSEFLNIFTVRAIMLSPLHSTRKKGILKTCACGPFLPKSSLCLEKLLNPLEMGKSNGNQLGCCVDSGLLQHFDCLCIVSFKDFRIFEDTSTNWNPFLQTGLSFRLYFYVFKCCFWLQLPWLLRVRDLIAFITILEELVLLLIVQSLMILCRCK